MRLADQPDNLFLYGYNLNDRLDDPEVFDQRPYDLINSRFVGMQVRMSTNPIRLLMTTSTGHRKQ